MNELRTTALLATFWLTPGVLHAHDLGLARVALIELPEHRYRIEYTVPLSETPEAPLFPERFELGPVARSIVPGGRRTLAIWDAGGGGALQSTDEIVLPWAKDGAFVAATWQDKTQSTRFFPLKDGRTVVSVGQLGGEAPGITEVGTRYGILGVEHILLGWDHLAFVLAIFILTRGRQLVRLITGFTLGHSATLIAAALGWVDVPTPPVEAAISLSIVLVAWQALSKSPSLEHGFWVVFGFGLLHGLGFAGVLADVGVPRNELVTGLLFFNFGVEVGQLIFVAMLAELIAVAECIARWTGRPLPTFLRPVVATGLVLLGAFWTIARVSTFAG